jgi:hypothetical protein
MYLLDKTIQQAELTLNLLLGSRINPKLSAWEQIRGRYDYNAQPFAPPGIKVLTHAKSAKKLSWSTHAYEAWHVGPTLEHCCCYTIWATATRPTRIVSQLTLLSHRPIPRVNSQDLLRATIQDLLWLLKNPPAEALVGHLETTQRDELT